MHFISQKSSTSEPVPNVCEHSKPTVLAKPLKSSYFNYTIRYGKRKKKVLGPNQVISKDVQDKRKKSMAGFSTLSMVKTHTNRWSLSWIVGLVARAQLLWKSCFWGTIRGLRVPWHMPFYLGDPYFRSKSFLRERRAPEGKGGEVNIRPIESKK